MENKGRDGRNDSNMAISEVFSFSPCIGEGRFALSSCLLIHRFSSTHPLQVPQSFQKLQSPKRDKILFVYIIENEKVESILLYFR